MAFADALRAATATFEGVADLMEDQLAVYNWDNIAASISTTSTSLTDYTNAEVSLTCADGDMVLLLCMGTFSNSASGNSVSLNIAKNGTSYSNNMTAKAGANDTSGTEFFLGTFVVDAPGAGSHTFTARWATSAGTAYSVRLRLLALKLRNS